MPSHCTIDTACRACTHNHNEHVFGNTIATQSNPERRGEDAMNIKITEKHFQPFYLFVLASMWEAQHGSMDTMAKMANDLPNATVHGTQKVEANSCSKWSITIRVPSSRISWTRSLHNCCRSLNFFFFFFDRVVSAFIICLRRSCVFSSACDDSLCSFSA